MTLTLPTFIWLDRLVFSIPLLFCASFNGFPLAFFRFGSPSISLNLASDLRVSSTGKACTITEKNTNETAAFLQRFISSTVESETKGLDLCHPPTAVHPGIPECFAGVHTVKL